MVAPTIPTRRISFEDTLEALPRHFAGDGDLVVSHLVAALSAVFPDGEDFFVRSVRRFRDQVDDPRLAREIAGFIGQEAMHGREHRMLNARLARLGYPTTAVERIVRWGLALRERVATPKANLAATAALEHFTATLAELLLTDDEVRRVFGDNEVRNLFLWHALEESEHKAVAFDVYRTVAGSERTRVLTMQVLRVGFVLMMAAQMSVSLALDPATYRPGNLPRSLRRFFRSPMVSRALWRQLKDYNRPDFHPNDRDTTALVDSWRASLFGEQGTLTGKLTRPGATIEAEPAPTI